MSSLTVKALHREFFYNGTRIPDPAPNLTVEQVRELLTPSYPEIATAITGGAGGHRRRPSLHVQPGHRQQGLILRLQAVSRCDLLPRPCSAPALQGSWSLPESSKQGGTS